MSSAASIRGAPPHTAACARHGAPPSTTTTCLRTDLLPLSLDGVFLQLRDTSLPFEQMEHRMPVLFSRRSTQRKIPAVAMLGHPEKSPGEYEWDMGMWGSCNGLILLGRHVFNPATLERARLPLCRVPARVKCTSRGYLVFDPAVSLHYEVVSVPEIPWFHLPMVHIAKHVRKDKPVSAMEWPPTPYIMHVFSSKTGEWKERPFFRQGDAAGTVADCWSMMRYPRNYDAYWHGALYVICEDNFVLRCVYIFICSDQLLCVQIIDFFIYGGN